MPTTTSYPPTAVAWPQSRLATSTSTALYCSATAPAQPASIRPPSAPVAQAISVSSTPVAYPPAQSTTQYLSATSASTAATPASPARIPRLLAYHAPSTLLYTWIVLQTHVSVLAVAPMAPMPILPL
jgi:hypothetical protein